MKFVCPSCKAKYQIADEKISGRTLKMDCRRCNTAITIRGDLPGTDAEQIAESRPASVRPPAASAAARRPGATSGGSSVGPHPSRPRTQHHQPGAAASTLAPAGSALGADFRRQSLAPSDARPSVLDQWHVAINDVPVGPMRREEVSRKIATGAVSAESLAWREGFDDWRPVRDIPELSALLRRAEPAPRPAVPAPRAGVPAGRLPGAAVPAGRIPAARPTATAAPAARGNVVPIGGRLGGAAPLLDEPEQEDSVDEPTQIASAAELGLLAFADAAKEEQAEKKPAAKAIPAPAARRPEAKPVAKPEPEPVRAPEPIKPAAEPKRASFSPPPPTDDGLPPLVDPKVTPAAAFAAAPAPAPVVAAPPPEREAEPRRGLPVGAWVGIAGAAAFGAVFAVIAAQNVFSHPSAPVAVATVTPPPATTPEVEPEPEPLVVPEATETPPEAVAEPETPAAPTGTTPHHRPTPTTTTPTTPRTTTPTTNPDFARFADDSSGGPATIESDATRRGLSEPGTAASRHELSEDEIRSVVSRERNGLTRCWETAIRGARETPTVRLDVALTIGSSGAVSSVTARGPAVGSLSECIERSVRRWRFPASSGSTETSFPIVFSGTS